MFSPFKTQDRALGRSGPSLIWVLFPSILMVMAVFFVAVQILGVVPDAARLPLLERVDLGRLIREVSDTLPLILSLVVLMMMGVLAALTLGLLPLRRLSQRAAVIGPATISQRLPLGSTPREVAPLVSAFNAALDRLEAGWRAQQEFSANAAHELRTPLATLRAQVESVLEPEERREAIEEFDRLSRLIAQLLALAEADSGEEALSGPFDLVEVARGLTSEMAGVVLAGGRDVAFESAHERWDCYGAPNLVEVALRNLLENATRHTPPGSEILVSIDAGGQLVVSDDGPGVPTAFRECLFRRFSKADAQGPGAGLGLSIVERVMALHGGEVRLAPSSTGARFILDFSARGDAGPSNTSVFRAGEPKFRLSSPRTAPLPYRAGRA